MTFILILYENTLALGDGNIVDNCEISSFCIMMHTIITIFYQSITDVTTSTSTTAPTTTAKPGTFIIVHFTDHIFD